MSEGSLTALQMAQQLEEIYDGFTEAIRSMGSKATGKKGKSKLAQSALSWIAGGHIKTERDVLCDKFLVDVQKQLEMLEYALEGCSQEEVQEALGTAAEIMSRPVPEQSNGTTSLMKRAMLSQAIPLFPRLSTEQLAQIKERLEGAYKKSQRLPVEKEALKEIQKLL